jgi:7-cyano-7-deazaguanine reductase
MTVPEFTCLCPWTGQPDFATITISYVPAEKLIELKSLKLYLWNFREKGITHEDAINEISDEIIRMIEPGFVSVRGDFNVRGGISTTVEVVRGDRTLLERASGCKCE